MTIEKLTYTKGERIAETAAAVIAAGSVAVCVVMMCTGNAPEAAPILILCSLIFYAVMTLSSVMPQHMNWFTHPEKATEKQLRNVRRGCILAKLVLIPLLFVVVAAGGVTV